MTNQSRPKRIPDLFDEILFDVANGMSLYKACESRHTSSADFYKLINEDEDLKSKYTQAREERGDRCLDKIEMYETMLLEGTLEHAVARVLIDTEKWKACKFYPKMYGDKQEITHTGSVKLMPTVKIGGKELDLAVGEKVD